MSDFSILITVLAIIVIILTVLRMIVKFEQKFPARKQFILDYLRTNPGGHEGAELVKKSNGLLSIASIYFILNSLEKKGLIYRVVHEEIQGNMTIKKRTKFYLL